MRDYGKISPQFWIGKTGKALRGNMEAQIVALYLMTCPKSEMTGVFHCPILYIAHETGLSMEGASKGLARLVQADFCTYEEDTETVFVHEMARYQIGDELKPTDNRVIGVQKVYVSMAEGPIKTAFFAKYKQAFLLPHSASPLQAPSKPEERTEEGTRTETGARAKQEQKESQRASRLPKDWTAPPEFIAFCKSERPDLNPGFMQDKFRDYWIAVPGSKGTKLDWFGTWRNFIRSERAQARASPPYQSSNQQAKDLADRLTGNSRNERTEPHIIDIN